MYELTGKKDVKTYYRKKCKKCRLDEIHKSRKKRKEKIKLEITVKTCHTCNEEKKLTDFYTDLLTNDGYNVKCKICYKEKKHKSKIVITNENKIIYCSKCNTHQSCSEFRTTTRSKTGYFTTCNTCWIPSTWTKEKQYASEKKYLANNKEKIHEKWKRDGKQLNRRLRHTLNSRIREMLQSQRINKNNKTLVYIGCDIQHLKKWFEYLFEENMTLNNYGEWHIDHVLPCTYFNLNEESQQKLCFNWSNLRPCWKKENLIKSNNIIDSVVNAHKIKVEEFIKINPLPNHSGNSDDGIE
jgi:hypothetical protein